MADGWSNEFTHRRPQHRPGRVYVDYSWHSGSPGRDARRKLQIQESDSPRSKALRRRRRNKTNGEDDPIQAEQ